MGSSRTLAGLLIALLVVGGAYLLLRSQAGTVPEDVAAPSGPATPEMVETLDQLAPDTDAEAQRARTAPARPANPAAPPPVALDKLLAVPESVTAPRESDPDEIMRRALAGPGPGEAAETAEARARRLGADVSARTDETVLGADRLSRQQVDADASVELGKGTSLKGGVRLERDKTGGVSGDVDATPRVGIEKRF